MTITTKQKNFILLIILVLVIGGITYTYFFSKDRNRSKSLAEIKQIFDESKKTQALETELKNLESQVKSLTDSSTAEDKYQVYVRMAEIQRQLKQYSQALESLEKIPSEKVNNRVYAIFAAIYRDTGDFEKARAKIDQALAIDTGIAEHWEIYFDVNPDATPEVLKPKYLLAIDETDNDVNLLVRYSKYLAKLGEKDLAVAYLETARNKDPQNADQYNTEISKIKSPQQ